MKERTKKEGGGEGKKERGRANSRNSRVVKRMGSCVEGVRRARMLAWTLKCGTGTCDTEGSLEVSMSFGVLVGTTASHMSLLPFGADR